VAFAIVTVPFDETNRVFHVKDLETVCAGKRIISHRAEFVQAHCCWTVFIEYEWLEGKMSVAHVRGAKADMLASLSAHGRSCFEQLRAFRRTCAEKEGVPYYNIASDAQLIAIVKREVTTVEGLRMISGFGAGRIRRYAAALLACTREMFGDPQ
jgi:superfamily II DNA helicase RecQ